MILTLAQFKRYQSIFYRKILGTPFEVSLEVVRINSAPTEEFSIDSFVGDSPRASKTYPFRALYEREIPTRTRDKFGLSKEVNGVIYISPLQLAPVLGDFKLDWNKTKVHFADRVQVIEKIDYLEPLYDSCIGLQIFIKDDLKGG